MSAEWLIEMGHSRLKVARYQSDQLSASTAITIDQFPDWLQSNECHDEQPRPDRVWLCAVPQARVLEPVLQVLDASGIEIRRISTGAAALPVRPAYAGLGVDRWLAMQPAWSTLQSAFVLIDCGTATTVDLVDTHGRHQGGWILPGRQAARGGLLAAAPGLERTPTETDPACFHQPARDTLEAVERGLVLQQMGSLALALQICSGDAVQAVITGGEAGLLRSAFESVLETNPQSLSALKLPLENAWLAPDLVLQGLAMAADELRNR